MSEARAVSDAVKQQFVDELTDLLDTIGAANAAVVSTVDGLPVVHVARSEISADNIAAMSASMLSLGDALGGSSRHKQGDHVLSQSETGTIVVIHAGPTLILTTIGKPGVNVGTVLVHSKYSAGRLAGLHGDNA